jgi:hypothetical protein
MKKTTLFITACTALLLASSSLFTSCKKDKKTEEEPTPTTPAPTNTEKILDKNFKVTGMSVESPIGPVDVFSQVPACVKDNVFTFEKANFYKEDEGPTKCDPMDNQQRTGTWKWKNNETEMEITSNGQTWTNKVILNDGTTFKFSNTQTYQGQTVTMITTMTKQ